MTIWRVLHLTIEKPKCLMCLKINSVERPSANANNDMWIRQLLKDSIKPAELPWAEFITFQHRSYYICNSLPLRILAVATEHDDSLIGERLVYPGQMITIGYQGNEIRILIPVEDLANGGTYWINGSIEEAF